MGKAAILTALLAGALLAQSSVRSGQSGRAPGAARPRAGIPSTPAAAPPPVSASRPAQPDARLGAGGIGVRSGNVVYPGSPQGARPGSIVSPGLPQPPAAPTSILTPGTPSRLEAREPAPAMLGGRRGRRDRMRGDRMRGDRMRGFGFQPVYWPVYGYVYEYGGPSGIEVQPDTVTESAAEYAIQPSARAELAGRSRVYEVGEGDEPRPGSVGDRAEYWLIALKGGLIYAVERYWMQNETFRFQTLDGKEFIVSPVEIDIEFTEQLNQERGRDFELP